MADYKRQEYRLHEFKVNDNRYLKGRDPVWMQIVLTRFKREHPLYAHWEWSVEPAFRGVILERIA
jgi:hypothetical protein